MGITLEEKNGKEKELENKQFFQNCDLLKPNLIRTNYSL